MSATPSVLHRPRHFLKKTEVLATWASVLCNSEWTGESGISYLNDDEGTQVLEYRDATGHLRGVLARYTSGEVFLMTDPSHRRQGIASALLIEAGRRCIPLDFAKQAYTRPGWSVVRRFLKGSK